MTPREMATLLGKAEGQYLMIYFLNLVTGMRISETVGIEIDKHIEPERRRFNELGEMKACLQSRCSPS